jgi:hypothetical protein
MSFMSVAQSVRVPKVPGRFEEFALGILLTEMPRDRDSSLQVSLLKGANPNSYIELDGQLKLTIPIKASSDGFTQIAYSVKNFVVPAFDVYRFVFYFDGSNEIAHYAPFVVLPLQPTEQDLPPWAQPLKLTRH